MQIFGTSLVTQDVASAAADPEEQISSITGGGLDLEVDARTLFVLIS